MLLEGVYDPGILKCVIMSGGAGAGKTTVSNKIFGVDRELNFAESGLRVLNTDQAFEARLKKMGLGLDIASLPPEVIAHLTDKLDPHSVVNQARRVTEEQYRHYMDGRLGMIIHTTGGNIEKARREKEELERLGYDVRMVYVNTSMETAVERNRKRERKMPDSLVREIWQKSQTNLAEFKKLFGTNMMIVDNSGPTLDQQVTKAITHFVNEPVHNPVGQKWIQSQIPQHQQRHHRSLDGRIKNPETGNDILVKTALSYPQDHPAHKAAVQQLAAHYNPLAGFKSILLED